MEGVKVSVDRIVVDFTNVYWDFFNPFQDRLCQFYNVHRQLREKGFKYHLHIRDGGHYIHIAYQLAFVPKARKNTLRIECHPDSLLYFNAWLSQIKDYAHSVLFVRCDVAFDVPLPLSELFTLSLTGRNMHTWKGTRYSNKKHQRQVAGYCRVYDKKRERMARYGEIIDGDLTRFEIVYAPDEKIPIDVLVQYPPKFSRLYICSHLTNPERMKPKLAQRVHGLMRGEYQQIDVTAYYRRQIIQAIQTCPTLDFDRVASEQWEDVITLPCAILGGKVSVAL